MEAFGFRSERKRQPQQVSALKPSSGQACLAEAFRCSFAEPPYAPTGLYLMSGFASSPDLNGLLVYCDRGDSGQQDRWCRNFDVHAELAGAQVEFSGVSLGTLNPSEVYPAVVSPDYSRGELVKAWQ